MKTIDILDRLIGFSSVSADSNLDIIDYIQNYLVTRGFEVHRISDKTGLKAGLFARIGPPDGAGILLSGHTDVVPTDGQIWTNDPFKMRRENDRAYGRGTTDMKGYLACMLALADRASLRPLKEPLKLAFSYDEEVGCVGIKSMIGDLARTIGLPRFCLVGEPTLMQVATGHKGKVALRATCHGMNGHSALAPNFLNALHLATDFVGELRQLQAEYAQNGPQDRAYSVPYSTLHVGKLSGGIALNMIPEKAVMDFEFRHLATHDPNDIQTRILDLALKVSKAHQAQFPSAKIDVQTQNSYPALETAGTSEIVNFAQKLTKMNGTSKVPFGTEAGYFSAQMGIPTIVCGPGSMEGQGHKPDEFIEVSQLVACDLMLAKLLAEITI